MIGRCGKGRGVEEEREGGRSEGLVVAPTKPPCGAAGAFV